MIINFFLGLQVKHMEQPFGRFLNFMARQMP